MTKTSQRPRFVTCFTCLCGLIAPLLYQVQHMRRNLDQSEAAIIQVFEEKQRVWERQMDELRQNYASRLQQVTSLHVFNQRTPLHFIFLYLNLESKCSPCEILEEVLNEACGPKMIIGYKESLGGTFTNNRKIDFFSSCG